MHRSRIGVFLIDHPAETYDVAAAFWASATGSIRKDPAGPPVEDPYEPLDHLGGELHLELQRIGSGTPARVHLDIETDDVPAEVERLRALGAVVLEDRERYRIMADPGGLVFCVVPVQTDDFHRHATTWD